MKHSSILGHAAELLAHSFSSRQPADGIAREFFRGRTYLGSKDRKLISEYYYGVLRHFRFLLELLKGAGLAPGSPEPQSLLLAYCIRVLSLEPDESAKDVASIPHQAAVDLPALAAALRTAELPVEAQSDRVAHLAVTASMPDVLVREWWERFGEEETRSLCSALNDGAPTTIRINTSRCTVEECQMRLAREGVEAVPTRYSNVGLTLQKRINAQGLQTFRDGLFEMQDEGSQLIALALNPGPGEVVIDACAGGGGKTLHIASMMKGRGTLIAIDSEPKRLRAVDERARRSGAILAHLFAAGRDDSAIRVWEGKADAVLIDAPCSGAGTFRRNPWTKLQYDEATIERYEKVQEKILDRYARLTKPGGRVVYATCTLTERENEGQVRTFLSRNPEFSVEAPPDPVLALADPMRHDVLLMPQKHGTDGFYVCVLRRRGPRVH